ncbi:MAG: InlB B-repeat-containing protein [Clostridia bacterium]|nr:InlB B-repeat-containing protein [Clostridia bacterium]
MKKTVKKLTALLLATILLFGIYLPLEIGSFEAIAAGASPAITYQEIYCNNNPNFSRCYQCIKLGWSAVSGASYYSLYIYQFDEFFSSDYTMNTLAFSTTCYSNSFDSASLSESQYLNTKSIWGGGTFPGYYVLVIPRNSSGASLISSYTFTDLISSIGIYDSHYIYFYYNDGTNSLFDKTSSMCHNGVSVIEWAELPSRTGYNLTGWSKNKNATTAEYSINDTFDCGHEDTYYYAIWSPNNYTIKYNANGGSGSMSTSSHTYDQSKSLSWNQFTRSGYQFLGWSTNSSATSATYSDGQSVKNLTSTNGATVNLYAIWSKNVTYTVSYNANGGSGAPSSQTKEKDVTLTLRSTTPSKSYTVSYNANGGSVSSSSKTVNCTFKNWNTSSSGSGTTYYPGGSYTSNSNTTLYAQWTNPTYGTLPTPTRSGYTFNGWYTSSTGGTKITSSSTVTGNTTIYAHWTQDADEYNLGEETYRFENYSDALSQGHCFGMSVTSSGYHLGKLDIKTIGGSATKDLYMLSFNSTVSAPICHYQKIQGSYIANATVAGNRYSNTSSDWNEVVNYVKNHQYDDNGKLVIILRNNEGGHAVNFLRYSEVNGQARIYAYDNNFPTTETYFYLGTNGKVKQAPRQTFSMDIDRIGLMDTTKYLNGTDDFNAAKYIYADSNTVTVSGATAYDMYCSSGKRIMYEIPANATQVTIVPLKENAEFEYLDKKYEFNAVNEDTYGVLTLSTGSGYNQTTPKLEIKNEPKEAKSIVIKKLPTNTTCMYKYGGVNLAGIELEVTYVDGTRETVTDTSNMHVSNFTPLTTGTQTVTIEYCGARASLDVTVKYTWWQWIIVILLFGWIWY